MYAIDSGLVLAGDINDTRCRFGLYDRNNLPGSPEAEVRYSSRRFSSITAALAKFMQVKGSKFPKPGSWCIALGGSTDGRCGRISNLPNWAPITADAVSRVVNAQGSFICDLVAAAEASLYLSGQDITTLHRAPRDPKGSTLICGIGNNLGLVMLEPVVDGRFNIIESAGSGIGFAPCTQQQVKLHNWLTRGEKRASNETVLSAEGLYRIFSFIEEREPTIPPARQAVVKEIKHFLDEHPEKVPSSIIARFGISGEDEACRAAINLYCEILGAVAGDYALMAKATGGVYLVGEVILEIVEFLPKHTGLLEAFINKGRLADLAQNIPLVAVKSEPSLMGAAMYAAKQMSG